MIQHPVEAWTANMDDAAFLEWTTLVGRFGAEFWHGGDADRFAASIAEDVRYHSRRRFDVESYIGRDTYIERLVQARAMMPTLRRTIMVLSPPDRFLARVTLADSDGNEQVRLVAERYEAGLLIESVAFDDDQVAEATEALQRLGAG